MINRFSLYIHIKLVFLSQSDIGVNATVKTLERQSCVKRNSDGECIDSVENFLDKPAASGRS